MTEHTAKQGVVSVFLGVFPSSERFENYLRETRNEDKPGIATTCPFWDDLGVAWLDHDFQDAHYQSDDPVSVSEFLSKPFSYLDSFCSGVVHACSRLGIDKVNAGILLYNFEYPATRLFPSSSLRFIGCFPYMASTPDWLKNILTT
jgi:hypothetical protein